MPRYIDAEELRRETEKRIAEAHEARMAVVDEEFIDLIDDAHVEEDVVEVVRCSDCAVPHNRWTGCPNLNGMIPPPDFYCARGERKQQTADATDKNDGHKSPCKVCERITEANKDIFWVFARTHQFEYKEEYHRVPVRFCPACGREIGERHLEEWERKDNRS